MNKRIISAMVFMFILPLTGAAGENEDELIIKITVAYGGEALLNIENYQVSDHYLLPLSGKVIRQI